MYAAYSLHRALVEDRRQQLMAASRSWRTSRLVRSTDRQPRARQRNDR